MLSDNIELKNFWSMSNLFDTIGGATLYGGQGYSFVADRFGQPNMAVSFQNGYLEIPEGLIFLNIDK